VDGGIDGTGGSSGGPGAVVGRIRQCVVVGLLRTVIGRRGVAVGPGMDGIRGARGDGVVEGWGRVCGGGRVVVARIDGTIS
jgi:hypothetical protein